MQKLYKKKDFRDNCGFGLIASIDGVKSRKIITDSINALISMTHRGGIGADGKTGDGCGLLVDINETYYKDKNPRGHAIECRINAEDASKNFQPSPGVITMCHQPSGFRTRVDGAIFQGYKVTPYYDSMVCKLICHGRNRTEAIQRMNRSLDEFVIEGITTTIPLHRKLLNHSKFINSDFNTSWLDRDSIV